MTEPIDTAPVAGSAPTLGQFYLGTVLRLHRNPERGYIRTGSGRDLPFVFHLVRMIGDKRRFRDLREGMRVGYDMGWTDRGLRVSAIRIPDDGRSASPSEGELGAKQNEAPHHLADEHRQDGDVE